MDNSHTIVLDPGHGGRYNRGGGSGGLIVEKDHVLTLAKKVFTRYSSSIDTLVYMTRTEDVDVPHHVRCNLSHDTNADLVLSLHINSQVPPATLRGFRAIHWPYNRRSRAVGHAIAASMPEALRYSRPCVPCFRDWYRHDPRKHGWKHYPGKIIAGHSKPDCLVLELGFIGWDHDYAALLLKQDEIADAICAGIEKHREVKK